MWLLGRHTRQPQQGEQPQSHALAHLAAVRLALLDGSNQSVCILHIPQIEHTLQTSRAGGVAVPGISKTTPAQHPFDS